MLAQEDRDGVDLLAGGTAGAPDIDARRVNRGESGQNDAFQRCPYVRVPEELADIDGDGIDESRVLLRIVLEQRTVLAVAVHLPGAHANRDATAQATFLVAVAAEAGLPFDLVLERTQLGGVTR
jgi:hypothetical protein